MIAESKPSLILGSFIFLGLTVMGAILGRSAVKFRELERAVSAKGLAEREIPADVVVWPIRFTAADNELATVYASMESGKKQVVEFLTAAGFAPAEITTGPPVVTDKLAQQFGNNERVLLRYTARQTITVYSQRIDLFRTSQDRISELGKKGLALAGDDYQQQTQFLFTKLNDVKPAMIEEATRKAREVAEKFASDSNSRLGKIKSAAQGQFTVEDRDANTPHIKRVRVVSTIEYYLAD